MPFSMEAEQAVIGSMMMDNDAIGTAAEILTASDFYQKAFGQVFDGILALYNTGKPVDPTLLQETLQEMGATQEATSLSVVYKALDVTMTSANIKYYANIVYEKSILRQLIRLNDEITTECYSGSKPLAEILERTEKSVYDLIEHGSQRENRSIRQIVTDTIEQIEENSRRDDPITGIPTGYTDLDAMLSGLHKSELVLIAARPSMGKTAFALNIAQNIAFRQNKSVVIFSLEMSCEQLVNRFLAMESSVEAEHIRSGRLDHDDWGRLIEGSHIIANSNLILDDTPALTLSALRSKCRKYKIEREIDLVIIDYLQLMSGGDSGRRSENRQQEISDISRGLKQIARELNVPVVALSQLSRAVDQRPDHRPQLSDLRESGAIEQDADVVMFIYRASRYAKNDGEQEAAAEPVNENDAEIIVAKQRNGPTGIVHLTWMGNYTRFTNAARRDY